MKNALICQRATSPARIAAAVQRPCARCRVVCWVSPASAAAISAHGADFDVVCIECGVPEARAAMARGEMEMLMPTALQLEEVRGEMGPVDAQALHDLGMRFLKGARPGFAPGKGDA